MNPHQLASTGNLRLLLCSFSLDTKQIAPDTFFQSQNNECHSALRTLCK